MALPTNLAAKLKSIPMDPTVLASDPELGYTLSFANHNISHESIYIYPRDLSQSPLEHYQFADFDDKTYEQLLQETMKTYRSKNKQLVKAIRCGFKQFFGRAAAHTYNAAIKFMSKQTNQGEKKLLLPKQEEEEYRIQKLKGNNPAKWPETTRQFVKDLNNLPWYAFSSDSQIMFVQFVQSSKNAIMNLCHRAKFVEGKLEQSYKQNLLLEIEAYLGVILRTNSQTFILQQLRFISELRRFLQIDSQTEAEICTKIANFFTAFFKLIKQQPTQKYHHPENLWGGSSFLIMKKIHFQKYNGLAYYSVATDGEYLYFYISAVNGGMFKIGTGQGSTQAGKIYLEKNVHLPIGTKADEVNWIYLKGKLYLKLSSKDPWILEVIDPLTFKRQGTIQLFCPSLYGQQSLINLNKNSPLMTDGSKLYCLGNRIKICKSQQPQKQGQKESKSLEKGLQEKKGDQRKKVPKKKPGKKNQPNQVPAEDQKNQNFQKILEIVLYEFSVDEKRSYVYNGIDEKDIEELYNSFSGYFTKEQCTRALILNNYDLAETCQWLFNEGQKQKDKNIKIIDETDFVILAQCEITSNFQQKAIKGPAQITTKEGSVLTILNLTESIWTMDHEHITCYSESGTKIFSKSKKDSKTNIETKLNSTLLKVIEAKVPRNPEYNIIYDPYNNLFYTFMWSPDGHYFPAPVLITTDKKHTLSIQEERRSINNLESLKKLQDIQKLALYHMKLLDKNSVKAKYRFNDWLWFYGQRIIEVSNEMNEKDSDKKRLSNKRTKLLVKINKINEVDKIYEKNKAQFAQSNKIIRKIVKIYPFEAEGTLKNYIKITEAFRNIEQRPSQILLYVLCLQNWLMNCSIFSDPQIKKILLELGTKLMNIKNISNGKSRCSIFGLLIRQFYLFFPTLERQIKFITSLSQHELKEFISNQYHSDKKEKESIIYQITKKENIIQKYEISKCDFAEAFKSQSNIAIQIQSNFQSMGNLFFSDILTVNKQTLVVKQKFDQSIRKQFLQFLQKQLLQGTNGNKLIEFLVLSALKLLNNHSKDRILFLKYQTQMFIEVFRVYEKVISKDKNPLLFDLLPTLLFIIQIYHGSLVSIHPNQQIIALLLRIIEFIQKPELNQMHNLIEDNEFEGLSATTEKIYQSSHPLQRGKNYNFSPRHFNNAAFIVLDLDKRCQSDNNNDTLNIQIIHEDTPVGNNIQVNDGVFNSNLRMSGTIQTKKPYIVFGNSVTVDFNSSGHVKDAHSLVRYGFKFGLRPIYTGRIKLNEVKKEKIVKLFKNLNNFENYFNTIKFAAVALSSTLQNYLYLQNETVQVKINELLRGKVFKEGFQESVYQFNYNLVNPVTTVDKFIKKMQGETVDKQVLKKNHEKIWIVPQLIEQKKVQAYNDDLWNFREIPVYIRNYLEQIKQFKGDFIQVFTEARLLAKQKGTYANIMRKKALQEHKTLWLQGEAILFLTILKHSGLLHLNLKFSIEYIKQNLKAFEDARDGIYNSFITRIQYVNEWRNLIQTYIGKEDQIEQQKKKEPVKEQVKPAPVKALAVKRKGPTKTVKIGEKIVQKDKKQEKIVNKQKIQQKPKTRFMPRELFEKQVRERLSNEVLIKGICNIKNIKYDANNQYETATIIINELIKAAQKPLEAEQKAYKDPIEHLIRGCLFLLKFKSPSTKESLSYHQEIVPIGIGRSLSSDNRNVDANKLNLFREWLQNWKNWKGFKKEGRVQLQFPVEQIVKYINSWIDLSEIYKAIDKRYEKCQNRIQYYAGTSQLLRILAQTKFIRYSLGSQTINLTHDYQSELQSINAGKLKELADNYKEFKANLKNIENILLDKLPLTMTKVEQLLKLGSNKFLEKIKLLGHSLFLLESQNPDISLNILLYFLSFKYLSTQNQDIIFISNALIQRGFVSYHNNEDIISCLVKEVGNNNINYKRWKDYFFIERVLFLLRKLQMNLRSKKKVINETQVKIGQSIFYILYHIEIPLITRLGLKILKRLNISLKDGIKTPFDYEYKLFKRTQKNALQFGEAFKVPGSNRNNVTLLCSKINSVFNVSNGNQITLRFDGERKVQEEAKYNIILNLHQEEDLYWMIKVLYYIDELEKKKGEKVIPEIKDFDEYLQLKNRKRDGEKKQQQQNNQANTEAQKDKNPFKEQEKNERIFNNIPKYSKIDAQLEQDMPVGWFFNYCNIFSDAPQKVPTSILKIGKTLPNLANLQNNLKNPKNKNNNNNNNNAKKNWNTAIYTKIAKKYEQFNSKPPQEPKQGDSAEAKQQYVKARNIYSRFRRYLIQISMMIEQFSRSGYYLFREDVSKPKMNQICQLITSGSLNRLKDISIELKNNDIKNRLTVNDFTPNFSTKLKITIIKTKDYPYFDNLVSYESGLSTRTDHSTHQFYSYLGKRELSLQDAKSYMPYEEFIPFDEPTEEADIEFGKQWIESSFSRMKKKYEKVYLSDYPNDIFYLGQGGIESGIKDNILVPANDNCLTLQTAIYQKIMTQPKFKSNEQFQQTQLPEELIEKINQIIDQGSIQIANKDDIRKYLLLTFYLKKLKNFDLQFLDRNISKDFAQKVFKFTENLNSYQELSTYKQDIQKLIIKLIDNEHDKLHIFGTYLHDDDFDLEVEQYLVPLKLEKLNSSNQVKQQTIQTHSYIKSKYLLKSQPPQIQQNKLLKYWEKNILPNILEFVKTTLKPLQIQDFWQQMRRPLRVGDHTEAKRVAYIICDNKLPAGAVLPDASHNWNSLQIQEIFVGENVLIKISKNKSDFCTPLLGWGNQDHKLGKIVFVDIKNSSVLVRYRLQQLAIFSYAWVPINALMAVQKEVMHISTKSIYEEISKKLQGMIYIYAKECLTKLASNVSEVDNIKLIKETILDLFIKNPISGSFNFPKPVWSMRPIFEKMLQQKNYAIVDILEKNFCSIKGIDLNLNSQNMTQINRFEDAKALIVSFKKDARLAVCSGVRFYNDKFGYNQIHHVYTAKTERTDIQPLQFNEPNIYCRYYTNKECLPIVEQSSYKIHPIEVTIFAVDDMWTIGCYIGQVVCEIASVKNEINYLEVLQRLNTIFLKWISKKSVSILCGYLSQLISKISLTIVSICQKNGLEVTLERLGTNVDQLKNILEWITVLLTDESNQKVNLYSALLQNLSEMVGSILVNTTVNLPNVPEHIKASIDLIKMFREIDNFTKTKKMSLVMPNTSANYQWERILQISNIPAYFNQKTIITKIKEIVQHNKGKILCPNLDVYLKNGVCYVLVDGWDINELVQEEVIEKMEQELEEQRQEQMNQNASLAMQWQCPACTFKNPSDTNMCQVCQTPAPVAAKQEEVYQQVEATDLKAAQRKVKQRESKRFEEVKVEILKFFDDEYKAICDTIKQKNNETEQNGKNKDGNKNKKANEAEKVVKQTPQKPNIKLETGSGIFSKENIAGFLQARFQYFPSDLKKLVQDCESYIGKFKKLLNLGYDLWGDNITNENATLIPFSHLYLLMDYVQTQICKGSSSVLSYSEQSIRILSSIPLLDHKFEEEPINYTSQNDIGVRVKYKILAGFKSYNNRFSWKLVKELNLAASKCLQFINMDLKFDKQRNDTYPVYTDSLGYKFKYFRNLIMRVIKLELFQKIMQKTSVSRENDEVPKVFLERLKVRDERARIGLITAKEKEEHLFTKAHDQFLKISPAFLRPFKPKGADPYLSFTVTFKGQNVMGEAGPYRQFFTDLARELDPTYSLGLFIPSPNNRNQSGEHKSKWVINPKANSTYHFSLFEYIGTLMGCCFRTGSHIALDLPTMFWKSIIHEQITEADLQEVDSKLISQIKILKECPSKEAFEEAMDLSYEGELTWVYSTCDGEKHQMIYNGKNIPVQFEDIGKYIEMLKFKRINESKLQIKRIVQGISQLIPLPYLHCLTGEELKLIICGRPKVDVDLLKKHTKYSAGLNEQSRRIKYFWQIMRELPESERLKIIRFCWGQQRLPINSEQFERNNIRFMIKPMVANNRNQDQALPKADTCFFNIELPDYSTKTIMRDKLLLAVNLDNVSINADEINNDDNPLMNEIETYGQEEYQEGEEEW